ncbi:MAG: hypothetical protein JNG88_05790, partial [Phycisphaerales bacterium]|nr:hypothetical protein [Phycisphaerales bacterium]
MSVRSFAIGPEGDLVVRGLAYAGPVVVSGIGLWDGIRFQSFRTGLRGTGYAIAVGNIGCGTELFGADYGANVSRWTGQAWEVIGNTALPPNVHALCVFDDGDGPCLYAGGDFLNIGTSQRTNFIAKWDGVAWRPMQTGLGGHCYVLKVYDDGTGPALFAGGPFSRAGDQTAWSVAKWDGQQWHGFGGTDGIYVYALEVWDDDGDGPRRPGLYVGGQFDFAVQPTGEWIPAENMARWDGQAWEAVGAGTPGTIRALKVHDDGTG